MAQNNANERLHDLLISKNFEPQSLNNQGKPAENPAEADLFSFDYKGESGQDYGTVVIMLDDENDLNVYFGDNIGKSMESDDKKGWFDFLYQLRMFAKRNLLSFSLQNLNKLKYSMQGQAAINEGLFESWAGTKTQSWNGSETDARLMIKHKRAIGENDARFRYIESLFVETVEGERYKLPFTKLSAGRAMLEHVRQGGKPYDVRGQHIATIVNEMNLLSRFKRANQNKVFEGETQQLVEQATQYYETLQNNLKSLSTRAGYTKYFESWNPAELSDEDVIIEDLRHMFIEQNIDSRIEQALPLLAKLQREQAMKEVNIFENWTDLILEGTWAIPDTKEKQAKLVELLSQELPVGPDATNATELLYDLLGDDELFDRLEELADQDANADARDIILTRLEQLKTNPAVAQVIGQLKNPKSDLDESVLTIGDTVRCPGGITGEIVADEGDRWIIRDLHSEFEDDELEFRKSDCTPAMSERVKDPRTQTEDPPNTPQPKVTPNTLSEDGSPVESAIIRRIMMAHPDLLAQFGPEAVMDAARDEADFVGDVDEIGSSDVSGWVNNVIANLNGHITNELSPDTLKRYVKRASSDRAMRNFDQGVDSGSSMNDREPKYDVKNARKDDQRRHGIHKALDRLEEGAMKELSMLYNDWENSEYWPYTSDAGDYNEVMRKAMAFLLSYNLVSKDKAEDYAEYLTRLYHGEVEEGAIGKSLGFAAGELLAPEIPGSGLIGAHIGDKIGDKIHSKFSKDKEVDETVGGGSWLEGKDSIVSQMTQVQDEIEKIVRSGGRVGLNDPLSQKLKMLKAKLHRAKNVNENTALSGQYGHSGKMEPVEGIDEDMMARIKFLAGIKETDDTAENQENSNLTAMKSVSSIFLR